MKEIGTEGNEGNRAMVCFTRLCLLRLLCCLALSVNEVHPILLSYMKLLDIPLGLIINFNESKLIDGVSRLILPGTNLA